MGRLAFVVDERNAAAPYLDQVRRVVGEPVIVGTVSELFSCMVREQFSGILLDVPTLVRASTGEKASLYDLLNVFPVLRVKWDPRAATVRALFYDRLPKPGAGLEDFVRSQCAAFAPRSIRRGERIPLHCNVMVSNSRDFPPSSLIRTVTLNVSAGGCFLIGAGPWARGRRLWLRIVELEDQSPIEVEIRWGKEWGESLGIPGAGVRFLSIAPQQLDRLTELCRLKK